MLDPSQRSVLGIDLLAPRAQGLGRIRLGLESSSEAQVEIPIITGGARKCAAFFISRYQVR